MSILLTGGVLAIAWGVHLHGWGGTALMVVGGALLGVYEAVRD